MSLRDKLQAGKRTNGSRLLEVYGVKSNPFPTANQTSGNPHYPIPQDDEAEDRIITFIREGRSEVMVVLGTQGVGKTNFLNYLENEIRGSELDGYYVVRYMADPEPSFDATVRTIFQELGVGHLQKMVEAISESDVNREALAQIKSFDLRQALLSLAGEEDEDRYRLCMEWLLGFRVYNAHRNALGVNFRLDTVESRTSVLRDYVLLGNKLGTLSGVFLLLDELEKQAGVLGPRAVVRYLSALRAIIDALPRHLFLIIAVTPDAMRRYSSALPAFRSRLENQISLSPLGSLEDATKLAKFYLDYAQEAATEGVEWETEHSLITEGDIESAYGRTVDSAKRRGDAGLVRQREFLNFLHNVAEERIQAIE